MILFPLFISLFLIQQLKTHFQTCLCAIPKWTCDCRLPLSLWQSFGPTAHLERDFDVMSFLFKPGMYQFSGPVFSFHRIFFFLPVFVVLFTGFLIIMMYSSWFLLFSGHSISSHKCMAIIGHREDWDSSCDCGTKGVWNSHPTESVAWKSFSTQFCSLCHYR